MRTLTQAQTDALAMADRATFYRVKVEDPDGSMVNVSTLGPLGESLDFLDQIEMDANTDQPIGTLTVSLFRKIGDYSIAPLVEGSLLNRNAAGSYAPLLNPNRQITLEVATLASAEPGPESGDWVKIFDGYIDQVDWGGLQSHVRLRCRDGMAQMNDKFIETTTSYGDDAGTLDVEDVMQDILDDNGFASVTLAYTATSFAVREYELGNVTVLEALNALRDLIGWNVTWKWNAGASDFRLTLWEPNRTNTIADYTFGTQDYYLIPNVDLNLAGIRNKGEVVYITTGGTVATATETRTSSVNLYSTRFIRVDARGTSVVTATQASDLLDAVLDDLEEPSVQQQIELPFFWPVELGDLYAFSANEHYDTEQKWGVFGFRHLLGKDRRRTILSVSGKPSGGFRRWHHVGDADYVEEIRLHKDTTTRSHTGDTSNTEKERVGIPALYPRNEVYVRARVVPGGTAGTKTITITLDDGSSTPTVAAWQFAASDTVAKDFDFVVEPTGTTAGLSSSPVQGSTLRYLPATDFTDVQDVVFSIQLANSGDSAQFIYTEVGIRPTRSTAVA